MEIAKKEDTEDRDGSRETVLDIRACLSGDTEAYRRIVRRHERQVARLMTRFSSDPAVVRELVQETFVEAWLALDKYRASGPFGAWLRTVAVRAGYRYWRVRSQKWKRETGLSEVGWGMLRAPEKAGATEAAETVARLLEQLEPADRLVLTLAYWEGRDTRQIAADTGWSHVLVRVRMHRARGRLRGLLEREKTIASGMARGGAGHE